MTRPAPTRRPKRSRPAKRIVLGVTGSIAVYTACDLLRRLREEGDQVTVVMTRDAQHFATPLTFAALSGNEVFSELFKRPQGSEPNPVHTVLAETADLICIAPATADIIGKIASGLADDLLTCVVMASTAPKLIAPAMNVHMYENPIIQENIAKLTSLGYHFIGPRVGKLACGYEAIGHIAPIDEIVQAAHRLLT